MDGIIISQQARYAAHVRRHASIYLVVILAAIAVAWQALSLTGHLRADTWPAPTRMFSQLWHDLLHAPNEFGDQNSTLPVASHVLKTIVKWAIGYAAAVAAGLMVGFVLGASRTVFALGHPVVNVLRSLPSAAVWPLCVVLLGLSWKSQFFVIVFGSVWPVLLATVGALSGLPQEVRDGLEFMQLARWQRMVTQLRWALPGIFTGIEISCSVAFLLTITVELFHPGNGGVGWYVWSSTNTGDAPTAFAGLLLTGLLGWLLNTAVYQLRRYLLFWEHGAFERMHPFRSLWLRVRKTAARERLLSKVSDARLRGLLCADHVTGEVRRQFGDAWNLRVLYNKEVPYIWPSDLRDILRSTKCRLLQRDVVIEADVHQSRNPKAGPLIADGPSATSTTRPILFAQSWIDLEKLSLRTRESLHGGGMTLGDAINDGETDVSYENMWYRSVVSDRLGRVLASSGSVETIQRCRKIYVRDVPVVLIHEYVPILLGDRAIFAL